ncbi:MAG TPA: DUF1254 domain-containing protein [Verrucomicrobiae bacterium]|nr:DUF1254 domain-containing protein [Verrucomicrobiae bacterium]
MTTNQKFLTGAVAFIIAITFFTGCKSASQHAAHLSAEEAREIATEAYIYGYPLVTMEYTRRVMTNVEKPRGTHAPMGQFVRMQTYPDASFKDVTAPNADTLYTTCWLDVNKEPWVLTLPDANNRYYLFPMLDGWTDVFQVPGKRTTGTGAQKYAITGPHWKGKLPEGVKEYKSPTSMVWLLGRIYCTGTPEDYAAVHKLQDQISVVPLSSYGKAYTPAPGKVDSRVDTKTAVREQVNALGTSEYFNLLAALMRDNPPARADAKIIAKMAKLGIVPGEVFQITQLDPAVQKALASVPKDGFSKIMAWAKASIAAGVNKDVNGWLFSTRTGLYGTEYLQRAFITAIGLGANRPQDAIYPTSEVGPDGKPYDGANKYVLHFGPGQLPPVNGFWSLTMYNAEFFFVENPLNRYSISARQDLKKNADGSVDLYLQHESPGKDKESNWLPAPAGRFILMFRFYWPKESIIDGSWEMPPVTKVN